MLTETEKRFVEATAEPECPPFGFDVNNPLDWPEIRRIMKQTAYHEAGHFAARCFTRLELSHVVKVSIIPDKCSAGRITSERNFARWSLLEERIPVSQDVCTWKRAQGIMLLLHDLAGYGADILSDPDEEWASICDYCYENYFDDDEDEGDMSRSYETANLLEPGYMSASRILRLADRWTLEMLRIPAVWNIVEVTHQRLLEHGELTLDELEDLAWNGQQTIYDNPKWRRRVFKELAKKRTRRAAA